MDKKCNACGYVAQDENAVFCEKCGEKLMDTDRMPRTVFSSDENGGFPSAVAHKKAVRLAKADRRKKKLFVLAFIGLLLDFIFGIGAFLCLPVAICASVDGNAVYQERKKLPTWQLWAIVIGYLGFLFGFAFFVLMF